MSGFLKVLIVDDDPRMCDSLKALLSNKGYTINTCNCGKEAIECINKDDFDLVFMDEQMPRKDGLEATRDILKYEKLSHKKHTPIIGLSANVIQGAKERALSFGCDAFLGKPLVIREFEKILQEYLEEQNALEEEIKYGSFEFERIDFNALKEELMLDDDEIRLLLKTFVGKMKKSFPVLSHAVEGMDFNKISLEAHSIKGSAANFRFARLEGLSSSMESAARKEDVNFDYKSALEEMEGIMAEIMA